MIPFATQKNIRLVLLNVHGYPGSTPYTDDELDRLEGSLEARKTELQARGSELAEFIRWFIVTQEIPPIRERSNDDQLVGGLSVLAWSGGNGHSLCMFAHADKLAEETRKLFDEYLRSLILYGMGFPVTRAVNNSLMVLSQILAALPLGRLLPQRSRTSDLIGRCLPRSKPSSSVLKCRPSIPRSYSPTQSRRRPLTRLGWRYTRAPGPSTRSCSQRRPR